MPSLMKKKRKKEKEEEKKKMSSLIRPPSPDCPYYHFKMIIQVTTEVS
jgi:hypothetical protein